MKAKPLPPKFQDWIDAQKKHRLSDAHIKMAKELGLNPKKLGKLDNHQQEPWKAPPPVFIENIYLKRFAKTCPDEVKSIEQLFKAQQQKKVVKRLAKSISKETEVIL
jgi:hypothetical protein